MLHFRTPLLLLVLFSAAALVGCDSNDLGPRGDIGPPGPPGEDGQAEVRVTTFTLNDRDNRDDFIFTREFSTSGNEVQYEADDDTFTELRSLLTQSTVDDGIVMLYVSDVIDENGLERRGWTALPITLGFDIEDLDDSGEGPDGFIDYTLTTTYTFDVGRLYVNLVASDDFTIDFLDEQQNLLGNLEDIVFRLVAIPGGGFARGIDYSDYEAVKQAYNLPD